MGGVDAAKRLIQTNPPENTFTWLQNEGALDLSIEFWMLKYQTLFTQQEIEIAAWRLQKAS